LLKLLASLSAEDIQLYYQIALNGRRDLPLAPDQRNGLEMVLLRMLAFRPDDGKIKTAPKPVVASSGYAEKKPVAEARVEEKQVVAEVASINEVAVEEVSPAPIVRSTNLAKISEAELSATNWHEVVSSISTTGILNQLVAHSAFVSIDNSHLNLAIAPSHSAMLTSGREEQLQEMLSTYFEIPLKLNIEKTKIETETPAARSGRQQQERQTEAENSIINDDNVKNIMDAFSANVDIESVQPVDAVTKES